MKNAIENAVKNVKISGSTVVLRLTKPVRKGQTINVAYTDPTRTDDRKAIQDTAGNDANSFNINKLKCEENNAQEIKLKGVKSGYLFGIDDDNQIFEINPQKKTISKVFDTRLANPRKSNGWYTQKK